MLMKSQKWFILLCIAVFVSLRVLESVFTDKKSLLVIGVLSAPNNFAARRSIRKTWKTLVDKSKHKFYFIIGNQACHIHPADRKSDLGCESVQLSPLFAAQYADPIWTPQVPESSMVTPIVTSFTFRVNFPVVVQGFSIRIELFRMYPSLKINLKNARTGTLITSALFPHSSPTNTSTVEVETKPLLLPKSFDAELQLVSEVATFESLTDVPCHGQSSWFNFSEAIEFTSQYGEKIGWSNFNEETCSPISVLLKLHDVETALSEKDNREKEWNRQLRSLSHRLSYEEFFEQDILFVDALDVYTNIPQKLFSFYVWVHQNLQFSFLLKADDDTFINLPPVENFLKSIVKTEEDSNDSSSLWWWGRFRHGLPVERHGKWQELLYSAPVYPAFPCGGGYILNKNVVTFLVTNSRWLRKFQGEDTSLGIWLAGVNPDTPRNATCSWVCGTECDSYSCNRGQLSADEMLSVWNQFQETQHFC